MAQFFCFLRHSEKDASFRAIDDSKFGGLTLTIFDELWLEVAVLQSAEVVCVVAVFGRKLSKFVLNCFSKGA